MAQALNMKRFGALMMALLIVMAVAGPVCLMFASSAMAMPMDIETSPCDEDTGSVACPYNQPDSTVGVTAPTIEPVAALAVLPVDGGPGFQAPSILESAAGTIPDAPPSHLTPLRI